MVNFITDRERWRNFGEWVRNEVRRAVVGGTYVCGLTGLDKDEFKVIIMGEAAVDKELVIRIAEVLGGDVSEGCRQAGYPVPEEYVDIPRIIRQINHLPKNLQQEVVTQVEVLYQKHLLETDEDTVTSEYVAIQEPIYDTSSWLTRFDDSDDDDGAIEIDSVA